MRLQPSSASGAAQQVIPAFCFAADAVGDVVYIMGNKVGDHYQVTRVNINNILTVPAIGLILSKDSSTQCLVQLDGIVRGLYTGLTAQKPLFINTSGRLTHAVPSYPTSGRRALQMMGQAIASDELFLNVKSPIILVPH
jgi:hypothetical protein